MNCRLAICIGMICSLFLFSVAQAQTTPPQATAPLQKERVLGQFGDWRVLCDSADNSACFMVLNGVDATGKPIVEFSLIRLHVDAKIPAGGTVIVPLGTALPEGAALQVDQGERLRYVYEFCAPAGCVANMALTVEQVQAMQAGSKATITIARAANPDKPIVVPISLNGFTAAYKALAQ
ncbi:MAG: invasion associated locus B family protein [Alphaproteobacteria bacterium]|nr:invasion associated locus B family protein [Alphaproteobacteria bacterium]